MDDALAAIAKRTNQNSPHYPKQPDIIVLVMSCKAHVLCILDSTKGAINHASNTILQKLDTAQDKLFRNVGLNDAAAFLKYNLAPLRCRRDIGMLGLVFNCVAGAAHPKLCSLLPRLTCEIHSFDTRLANARHGAQLEDGFSSSRLGLIHRSI